MKLSRVGCRMGYTLNAKGYEYFRPEGYAEVELDFMDDKEEAKRMALLEAEEAFRISALRQAELFDQLHQNTVPLLPKVKKWLGIDE
jgi:hypothetical protein